MKVRLVVSLTLLVIVVVSAAPTKSQPKPKPDFSGTWLLDQKKSNVSGLTTRPDIPIKIAHRDPEFRVTRTSESNGQTVERTSTFFTDGRGETNQATSGFTTKPSGAQSEVKNRSEESKTKWSGNKIVTRKLMRLDFGGSHVVKIELIHEWKLSDDGKVLTMIFSERILDSGGALVPMIMGDRKTVYNRV